MARKELSPFAPDRWIRELNRRYPSLWTDLRKGYEDPFRILRPGSEGMELIGNGYATFISGCARGFDTMAAETVLELRETYPWIQLEMVSPWDGQANRWSDADKMRRAHLFEQADQIIYISHVYSKEVYFKRNAWMVTHCDLLLAAFDGQPGGTAMTVDYAHEHGVKVARLLPVR